MGKGGRRRLGSGKKGKREKGKKGKKGKRGRLMKNAAYLMKNTGVDIYHTDGITLR